MILVELANEREEILSLLVNMATKNATEEELKTVIQHSLLVIDAERKCKKLEASYIDNKIDRLKSKYQG